MIARIALLVSLVLAASSAKADAVTGNWSVSPSDKPETVQALFVHDHSSQSSDWPLRSFKGLQLAPAERHDVRFTIERDAGRIEAEGSASGGAAAGTFSFTADPAYLGEMRKLGLGEVEANDLVAFALHDISLAYARDMAGLGLSGLTAGTLLPLRIHGADAAYVRDLRRAGVAVTDAGTLIPLRIHGVTPDFVAALVKLGYRPPEPGLLITMRIHGVTPEYIAAVKAKGVRDLTLEQLVTMKIQGID